MMERGEYVQEAPCGFFSLIKNDMNTIKKLLLTALNEVTVVLISVPSALTAVFQV